MASKQDSKKQGAASEASASKATSSTSSKAIANDAGGDLTQELTSLSELFQGDLSEIELEDAIGAIDEWHSILNPQKDASLKEISSGLKELKQLLKGGKASGHEIGEALAEVGHQTSELAAEADKGTKQPLQRLGKQLTQVGNSLGKAEDQEQTAQLGSVIETLEGDLGAIDPEAALGVIDHWYAILNKAESETLSELAKSLKHLKQQLKGGKAKGTAIAETLTQLGEQTTAAAAEATRGFKSPVQRLGKLLSKAGKALEKQAAAA
jgi:septation ring formation regulator EzrA